MSTEDHPMLPIHTILHPTDFSKHSDYALRVAGSLARDYGARLIVLHVLHAAEPPGWLYDQMAGSFPWTEDCNVVLEQKLRPIRESSPGLRVEHRVAEGLPPEEILRMAGECQCDLIVMGTQGRTGLDRILMGSVAEEVLRKARCPVLTVKEPMPAPSPESGTEDLEPTAAATSREEAGDVESLTGPGQVAAVHGTPPSTDASPVVVDDGVCGCCSVHTKQVHHRDFPEIWAEAGTVAEGASHLAGELARARDSVGGAWHREAIDRASADVSDFLGTLAEAGQEGEASCRCGARGPDSLAATPLEQSSSR